MLGVTQSSEKGLVLAIDSMPKAELHLHLEGSPRWATLRQALHRHWGATLPEFPPWCESEFRFTNFAEFRELIHRYIYPWLQTSVGYHELICDVVDSLLEQHIRYAEVDFYAALVEKVGASLDQVLAILEEEVERANANGSTLRIFLGINRHDGVENAAFWVKKLISSPVICGVDLHGSEVGWPADLFKQALAPAREMGKKIKSHAGEMVGPEAVRAAVEGLGVRQIGHGVSAIQDPAVVDLLRDRNVVVEMCPTSNQRLQYVSSYQDHPIFELDAAGIAVTVNSDDPTFFGANLTNELSRLIVERGATAADLKRWTQNAFRYALIEEETRTHILSELNTWFKAVSSDPESTNTTTLNTN